MRGAYLFFIRTTHSDPITLLARASSFSLSPLTSKVGSSPSSARIFVYKSNNKMNPSGTGQKKKRCAHESEMWVATQLSQAQNHHQHCGMAVHPELSERKKKTGNLLLNNRPFANELVYPDFRLLLEVIIYLPSRSARNPVYLRIKRLHLALFGRELQCLQFNDLRWERKQRLSLELRILGPSQQDGLQNTLCACACQWRIVSLHLGLRGI